MWHIYTFDTVNHEMLLTKLEHYGIRDNLLNWFQFYLSNQKQYVSINGISSEPLEINCGVPQGSVLGPLLFCFFILSINHWKDHICNLTKKRVIGIMFNLRPFVNLQIIKNVYYALFFSRIVYGIQVWGTACDIHLKALQVLQNRIV